MKKYFLLFVISVLSAVCGLGDASVSVLTAKAQHDRFSGLDRDGWMRQEATIELPHLMSRGNRLELTFDAWRPGNVGPAHLRVSVCGEERGIFVIKDSSPFVVPLKGECEPRLVNLKFDNPFTPAKNGDSNDNRMLGAMLKMAKITSRLGTPVLDLSYSLSAVALLFSVGVVVMLTLEPLLSVFGLLVGLLVPMLGGYFISQAIRFNFDRSFYLWLLSITFFSGLVIADKLRANRSQSPEPSGAGTPPWFILGVAAVTILGGILRFYGLSFGLPSNYHPDEVPKVNAIMRMVDAGNLNPGYFLHPSLLLYSTYFMNTLFHYFGMAGDFRDTAFFAGRTVSALAGTFSIALMACFGRRVLSAGPGLLSAALLAVFPLHVTCSRYMKEDSLLLFMVLAALVLLMRAVQEDQKLSLLLAGFFAGVSASSKYSGLLTVGVVAGAPWLRSRSFVPDWRYIPWTIGAVLIAPLGFLLCTPYALLTSEKFIKDFNSERNHMVRGHTIPFDAWSQYWTYHFSRSVIPGMSLVATLLGVLGLGVLLVRRRIEDLFIVGLVLVFYLPAEWVKAKPAPQPERYILPCLPFLGLAAAELLRVMASRINRGVAIAAATLAVALPLYRSVQLASELKPDTRDLMAEWMLKNVPHGSTVLLDWKPYAPRFFHNEFTIRYVPRATILENLQLKNLRESDGDYLVLSSLFYDRYFSQPNLDPGLRERFREVFEKVPVVQEFAPKYGTYGFHNPVVTLFSLRRDDFDRLDRELADKRAGKIAQTTNDIRASFPWLRIKKQSEIAAEIEADQRRERDADHGASEVPADKAPVKKAVEPEDVDDSGEE